MPETHYFASGNHISAVTLDGQANPVGRDRLLLSTPKYEDLQFDADNPIFDIMPDGERFVLLLEQASSLVHYNVVLNWFEELKARTTSK